MVRPHGSPCISQFCQISPATSAGWPRKMRWAEHRSIFYSEPQCCYLHYHKTNFCSSGLKCVRFRRNVSFLNLRPLQFSFNAFRLSCFKQLVLLCRLAHHKLVGWSALEASHFEEELRCAPKIGITWYCMHICAGCPTKPDVTPGNTAAKNASVALHYLKSRLSND